MPRRTIVVLTLIFCSLLSLIPKAAQSDETDEITAPQVTEQITLVQTKLKEYIDSGAETYAADETNLVKSYITSAEKFLSDGENARAFYEISIGKTYFMIIDARKMLKDSKEALEKTRAQLK